MASLEERAQRGAVEGWRSALALIAMSLGEEIAPSPQVVDAAREARRAIHAAQQAYRRFRVLAGHDDNEGRQPALPHTDADAARPVVVRDDEGELVVDQAAGHDEDDDEGRRAQYAQRDIDEQLEELGIGEAQIEADVEWAEGGGLIVTLCADGVDEDGTAAWSITRELDRVMVALKGLAPGCGPEAVRAALCGLEATKPEGCTGDGNCPDCKVPFEECNGDAGAKGAQRREVYAPTPADVLAELQRLDFDIHTRAFDVKAGAADPLTFTIAWRLHGTWMVDANRLLAKLRSLKDASADEIVELLQRLEHELPDDEHSDDQVENVDDEQRAELRKLNPPAEDDLELDGGFSEGEARSLIPGSIVLVRWLGAANGTNARRGKVDHVSRTGAKVFVCMESVDQAGEYLGAYGSVRTFPCTDILSVARTAALDTRAAGPKSYVNVGKEDLGELVGRPAGETPKKRRSRKAKAPSPSPSPESSAAAYYNDPGRRFTGD